MYVEPGIRLVRIPFTAFNIHGSIRILSTCAWRMPLTVGVVVVETRLGGWWGVGCLRLLLVGPLLLLAISVPLTSLLPL